MISLFERAGLPVLEPVDQGGTGEGTRRDEGEQGNGCYGYQLGYGNAARHAAVTGTFIRWGGVMEEQLTEIVLVLKWLVVVIAVGFGALFITTMKDE